ncbi:MAG TPA: hypothetical protein VFM31_02935 [Nitrososphaeraceae archaeon]|nr:hypothetical protein [Nitrososphaeraceae archaeon]
MESSLVRKIDNRNIDIDISSIVPSRVDVENLELSDFIIMATISHDFDNRLKYFFERDSFTVPDPFTDSDNYLYYLFVDKENHRYFISIVVIKKDVSIKKDTWDKIRGDDIAMLEIKLEQAYEIKKRLMPKHTNNFYPFRTDGKIVGYIMHAYQICGL